MTWADGVLALLTLGSVCVAVVALGHSRRATSSAAGAVLEAKDANKIAKSANDLSERSNAIAERAAQDARDAPTSVAWDEYVVALSAIQTFNPASSDEPVGPHLTAIRTRATLLIDRIDWEHFDKWVAAEQMAGVVLMREASEQGQRHKQRLGRPLTPDEVLAVDERFHLWVAAFTKNVRLCRRNGPADVPFERLTALAWETIQAASKRNGWAVPADHVVGLEPLDGEKDS